MTKETKVLETTEFISLNNDPKKWANIITEKNEYFKRINCNKKILDNGFDIKNEIYKLEEYYKEKSLETIIHVVNSKIFSGLESVACDIITSKLSKKYRFIYVTQDGPIVEHLRANNIEYELIYKLNCKEIERVLKKYDPQIIHAHDFTASVICAIKKKNKYLIEHLHNNCPWLKSININTIAFLFAGMRANKILTVSESIEQEYIFSKLIKSKIECIGNPVSREKILAKTNKIKAKKIYDICCVARLTEQKNPYKFLEIIMKLKSKFNSLRAVWVGDGEIKDAVEEKAIKLGLSNTIKFAGFQKNPYEYMKNSKIFLLTSEWEGYGLVAFEALTLGLPCVVSNVGGLPKIVDKSCGCLCNDEDDYINECIKLLSDRTYLNEKSEKSVEKSKLIENYNEYITKIDNYYEAVEGK